MSWLIQHGGAGDKAAKKGGSQLESGLTGLLHMCHRLCLAKCQAWLLPHIDSVWETVFGAFEAFCQACQGLTTEACAAAAKQEQQLQQHIAHEQQHQHQHQLQQQQQHPPLEQHRLASRSSQEHQQTVAERIALYNAMAKAGRASVDQQDIDAGPAETFKPAQSGSCQLLVLLSRCCDMESLLARLVPGFLTVLTFEGPQQVQSTSAAAASLALLLFPYILKGTVAMRSTESTSALTTLCCTGRDQTNCMLW